MVMMVVVMVVMSVGSAEGGTGKHHQEQRGEKDLSHRPNLAWRQVGIRCGQQAGIKNGTRASPPASVHR
jgi:hypothetical protein